MCGSIPGTGIQVPEAIDDQGAKREQIRCLSSVARPKTPKLRLEASCSAADAIGNLPIAARVRTAVQAAGACSDTGDDDRSAGLFDGGTRGSRGARDFDGDLGGELAATEQAYAVLGARDDAGLYQCCAIDGRGGVELAGVDRLLQAVEIDLDEILRERIVEAALGQAAIDRHLAALETVDGTPVRDLLTLYATAAGLALARADAAADAHARLAGTGVVAQIVQFHLIFVLLARRSADFVDAHQMRDLGDHAADRRRVLQLTRAVAACSGRDPIKVAC